MESLLSYLTISAEDFAKGKIFTGNPVYFRVYSFLEESFLRKICQEVKMDPRIKELSALLTGYSCALKPGEKVLIDYEGECSKPLVRQLI